MIQGTNTEGKKGIFGRKYNKKAKNIPASSPKHSSIYEFLGDGT